MLVVIQITELYYVCYRVVKTYRFRPKSSLSHKIYNTPLHFHFNSKVAEGSSTASFPTILALPWQKLTRDWWVYVPMDVERGNEKMGFPSNHPQTRLSPPKRRKIATHATPTTENVYKQPTMMHSFNRQAKFSTKAEFTVPTVLVCYIHIHVHNGVDEEIPKPDRPAISSLPRSVLCLPRNIFSRSNDPVGPAHS